MRIDAHQHFWIYNVREYDWIDDSMRALRRDFLPQDLKAELDREGFDGSILVQTRQTLDETRWLLELAKQTPTILGVVGWVDLRAEDVEVQLDTLARDPKLVGIRHIVQGEPDDNFLLREDFIRGISMLEDFALAYDILIYPRHLPVTAEFVKRFPRQRFVVDHMAKPSIKSGEIKRWADGIQRLAEFPNVFCKVSGLVTEADCGHRTSEQIIPYMDIAFQAFGPDRLMIGSDWPVCLVAARYERVICLVKDYLERYSVQDREAVMGGNAQRLWKIKGPPSR